MNQLLRRSLLRALPVLGLATAATAAHAQGGKGDKVVYHINDTARQATGGLRNIRNHLDVAPDTEIIVVTHAEGIDMMMVDARDENNPDIEYAPLIGALSARGVRFEVCEITLERRGLEQDEFVLDAEFTPSGVVRLAQLQGREGYAYIKP